MEAGKEAKGEGRRQRGEEVDMRRQVIKVRERGDGGGMERGNRGMGRGWRWGIVGGWIGERRGEGRWDGDG